MKLSQGALVAAVFASTLSSPVWADDWVPVIGADELRAFMSGLKAERELANGVVLTGEYFEDSTGVLNSWGASIPRTWEVKGDDQLCFTAESEVSCIHLEKSTQQDDIYRAIVVNTGEIAEFRVTGRVSGRLARIDPATPAPGSEGGPAAATAEEVAAELANPNTVLGTLNTNFDYKTFTGNVPGVDNQDSLVIGFQPSLPCPLAEGRNLFVRPLVPIIVKQPVNASTGGFEDAEFELGDTGFDAAYGQSFNTEGGANVVLVGVAGSIPTATDERLGSDQWTLGPELGAFMVRKWGVIGIIGSHQWDVAGEDSFDTSLSSGQYLYVFSAGDGWQIIGTPTWSYNHEAPSDDALTLPVGIGVAKTAIIGGRPWKFSVQYWNYIEAPDAFGPEHQIRFTVGPVVDLPWKGMK